jgi:hypothetical protein
MGLSGRYRLQLPAGEAQVSQSSYGAVQTIWQAKIKDTRDILPLKVPESLSHNWFSKSLKPGQMSKKRN